MIYVFEIKPICCLKALHTATITKWLFVCDIKATTILDFTRQQDCMFCCSYPSLVTYCIGIEVIYNKHQSTNLIKDDLKATPINSLVWWRWLTIMHRGCWIRFRQMFLASGSFHNHEPLNRWWNHTNRGDSNWEGCGERRSPPNPWRLNE